MVNTIGTLKVGVKAPVLSVHGSVPEYVPAGVSGISFCPLTTMPSDTRSGIPGRRVELALPVGKTSRLRRTCPRKISGQKNDGMLTCAGTHSQVDRNEKAKRN